MYTDGIARLLVPKGCCSFVASEPWLTTDKNGCESCLVFTKLRAESLQSHFAGSSFNNHKFCFVFVFERVKRTVTHENPGVTVRLASLIVYNL